MPKSMGAAKSIQAQAGSPRRDNVIEKPDLSDDKIIATLASEYALQADAVEFLPHGWDSAAWSYRVDAKGGAYYVKVRKEVTNAAGILLPGFLRGQGVEQVIVPLQTRTGESWAEVDGYAYILYPFVSAQQVMDVGMSDAHWVEFGTFLRRLHAMRPSASLLQRLRREDYTPQRIEWVTETHRSIKKNVYDDPFQAELAAFWRNQHETISALIDRTQNLARRLQHTELEFVLCHADIHTANILRSDEDRIYIVDWDECLMAPKERDLLFVLGGPPSQERAQFFRGYGELAINSLALAYYRYDWCIEDIGGFADRIFTSEKVGNKTKEASIWWFKHLFAHGDSVQTALNTEIDDQG